MTVRSGDERAQPRLYYTLAVLMCRLGNKTPTSAVVKLTSGLTRVAFIDLRAASVRLTGTSRRTFGVFVVDQGWVTYDPGVICVLSSFGFCLTLMNKLILIGIYDIVEFHSVLQHLKNSILLKCLCSFLFLFVLLFLMH